MSRTYSGGPALARMLTCGIGVLVAGCLDFGRDMEFVAPNVTAEHLQQISSLTGIEFPEASTGLAYLFIGSGIDDALAAKVAIPSDQKDAFLKNEVFTKGRREAPYIEIGKPKAWWGVDALADRTERTLKLPQGRFLECTFGLEDGQWVVYISWITT